MDGFGFGEGCGGVDLVDDVGFGDAHLSGSFVFVDHG